MIGDRSRFDLARQTRGPKSLVYAIEGRRTRQLERRIAAQSPVIVISHREAEILRDFAPDADCHTIANGIDADYFLATPPSPDNSSRVRKCRSMAILVGPRVANSPLIRLV